MRRKVLVAELKGYRNVVKTEDIGGRKINRPRWDGENERRYKRIGGKTSWYKKKKNIKKGKNIGKEKGGKKVKIKEEESDIEAVMFVPCTPGGALTKLLQECDDRFREGTEMKRLKMVEKGE